MEILFGVIVLALLIFGLRARKKQDAAWLQEERHDESGAWMDKRSGERGTFGSLDDEMETERQKLSRQGKIAELTRLVRAYFFEQHPDFHSLRDAQIKEHIAFSKAKIATFGDTVESALNGSLPDFPEIATQDAHHVALKKIILDFSFGNFPNLLDLEIDVIRKFDRAAEHLADALLREAERLRQ